MRGAGPHRGPAGEDGFTLVELLVTMSVAMVVLFAVLQGADVFARSTRMAGDVVGAQDTARATVRTVVQSLRQGRLVAGRTSPVATEAVPTRSDLVVAAFVRAADDPAPGTTPGWLRWCATAPVDGASSLLVGVRATEAYAAPGACAPGDTTNGWRYGVVVDGTLLDPGRLFDLGSGTCVGGVPVGGAPAAACPPAAGAISTVGVRVVVATGRDDRSARGSAVRAAVAFRNGRTP